MADYYVNLNRTNTVGEGDGSIANPWSWNSHIQALSGLSDYDTIYLSGNAETLKGANDGSSNPIIYDKWGLDPWRVSFSEGSDIDPFTIFRRYSYIYNAIISVENDLTAISGSYERLNKSIFIGNNTFFYIHSYELFKNCLIYTKQIIVTAINSPIFIDCFIIAKEYLGGNEVEFKNCAINKSSYDGTFSQTNCQFNWTPPQIPNWNDSILFWDYDIISTNVLTPPQPGYGAITVDSWGNTQIGIGAGYMGMLPRNSWYVDLSASSNGVGTTASPWNWDGLYSCLSGAGSYTGQIKDGDNICLRGIKDITNSPSGQKVFGKKYKPFAINFMPWNLSAYGPWGIYDSENRIFMNYIYEMDGGIIISDYERSNDEKISNLDTILLFSDKIETCFIKSERIGFRTFRHSCRNYIDYCNLDHYCSDNSDVQNIKGSSIIGSENGTTTYALDYREPTILNIKDSVVYFSSQYFEAGLGSGSLSTPLSAISANFNWVTTKSSSLTQLSETISTSASNMQYNWTVPTAWPDYSSNKMKFHNTILGAGITITGSNDW